MPGAGDDPPQRRPQELSQAVPPPGHQGIINCLFTIYNQWRTENFQLFCFDFRINSKYVILFHFESNQKSSKKGAKIRKYLGIRGRTGNFQG